MKQNPPTFTVRYFLHPGRWPMGLGLVGLWLLVQLPYPVLLKLGALLGDVIRLISRKRRHIAQTNIRLAFPELNANQQHRLLKKNFHASGMAMLEVPLSWWGNEKRLRNLLHINGLEHIQHALEKGHGAILLGGHFTNLIISGRLLALELPFNIVIKKAHNAAFEMLMQHYRSQQYQGLINFDNMRGMIRTLKNNQVMWYAPDQDFGYRAAVFTSFMGLQTATLTTTARLAKISKAAVIYINFECLPNAQGYQLTLHSALENFPSGDDNKDAQRINALIEQQVRTVPEQYLWIHRRFKTRPPGEFGVYGWADKKRVQEADSRRREETQP